MGLGRSLKKAFKKTVQVASLGLLDSGLGDGEKKKGQAPVEVPKLETVRDKKGLAATILTRAQGVEDDDTLKRKTLLGAASKLGNFK